MYCFADVILLHYGSVWEGHFFNGFQEIAKHFNYDPQVEKICTTFFLFLLLPTIGFSALEAMPKYEFARKEIIKKIFSALIEITTPNTQDIDGWTALHYAYRFGSEKLVDKLL